MTHLETELQQLKAETVSMWNLVISQLHKTSEDLVTFDKNLAWEIGINEQRVNAMELQIDLHCENIFALFNPVAVDLRFVLAILKINNNLERTGDIAEGIANFVANTGSPFDEELLSVTNIVAMHKEANSMMADVLVAFETEDTQLARSVFERDQFLDDINLSANAVVADFIRKHPDKVEQGLAILSAIRKLERVGDQCKNIAEEIIFYLEAKVMKHNKK